MAEHLVLNYFHTGVVSNHLTTLLQCFHTAYIHTDRCIEFQRTSTGCSFRIAKHHSNLLTKLVDKDHHAVGLADNSCQFTECL